MKSIVAAVALVFLSAGTLMAADVMTFPAKMGDMRFNHKKHREMVRNCKACHEKKPGKMEGFGKDVAHKLCLDCHKAKGKGPTACKDCHKKK